MMTSMFMADTQTPDILSLTPTTKSNIIKPQEPWGRLYPTYIHLKPVDLQQESFTLGRSEDADVIITEDNVPLRHIVVISKSHFTITRDEDLVYIKDYSKNGTFLNGELIGKGKTNILQNDDEISIGFKSLKVYMFKVLSDLDNNTYLPERLRKKYQVTKKLGFGACGEVKLVVEKTTMRKYAVKKIIKAKSFTGKNQLNRPEKIRREINILKEIDHPCIIKMYDIEETDDCVFIVLEYMEGGILSEIVKTVHPITEKEAKFLFYQMVDALIYLHSMGVIHRDLKPDNVLLKESQACTLVKISDFGLSRFINDDEKDAKRTICGTPLYLAPEIVAHKMYDYQADVWSLGVLLYYMLSQQVPFTADNRKVMNNQILKGIYDFDGPTWEHISEDAKDVVKRMLTVDPHNRIKLNDIIQHPWIAKDDEMVRKAQDLMYEEQHTYLADEIFCETSSSSSSTDDPDSPPFKRSRTH